MSLLLSHLQTPVGARVLPFAAFVILTFFQGHSGETGRYWLYLAKLVIGGWLLWIAWPMLPELRWKFSVEALAVGVGVFFLWVGLDDLLVRLGFPNSYPKMKLAGGEWNPPASFGSASLLPAFFIVIRILGASLVVPMLEEVFYRSFFYRYLVKPDFQNVSLGTFAWMPFLVTSIIFGLAHREWLAGILTGFAYQGLVCQKGRLGDAITAHGVTNLLLGIWVVWKGQWQYW